MSSHHAKIRNKFVIFF